MGVVADAALAAGGNVIGVITESLHNRGQSHLGLGQHEIVRSLRTRKERMDGARRCLHRTAGGDRNHRGAHGSVGHEPAVGNRQTRRSVEHRGVVHGSRQRPIFFLSSRRRSRGSGVQRQARFGHLASWTGRSSRTGYLSKTGHFSVASFTITGTRPRRRRWLGDRECSRLCNTEGDACDVVLRENQRDSEHGCTVLGDDHR